MKFRNEYAFLSNFAPSPLTVDGVTYPTVEHAFQAAKTLDPAESAAVAALRTPSDARRAGRRVTLRRDWEAVKEDVMLRLLRLKFAASPWREQLRAVDGEIVEENDWGDRYWGVSGGSGKNRLGALLMQVRAELE